MSCTIHQIPTSPLFSFRVSNFKPNRRNYVQTCFSMAPPWTLSEYLSKKLKSSITHVSRKISISPPTSLLSISLSLFLSYLVAHTKYSKKSAKMARIDMLVKLFMGFVYVNVILGYVESSYSGVTGYHDAIRRMALVKAAHIIRNGAPQPQSYSTPLVINSQDFLLFFFRLVS